jgi:hypothetical protein
MPCQLAILPKLKIPQLNRVLLSPLWFVVLTIDMVSNRMSEMSWQLVRLITELNSVLSVTCIKISVISVKLLVRV